MSSPQLTEARAHFAAVDPLFARETGGLHPIGIERPRDPFVALSRAIVGQQLSIKAAATIWARVQGRFGGAPDPDAVIGCDHDELRALGLSRQKAGYLHNIARAARVGDLDPDALDALGDADLIARLTAIKGVGRWTVEMIMMFGMQRPDVFSVGDLGLKQAVVAIYGLAQTGKALQRRMASIAEAWSPYRTTASKLLWAWHREHIKGARRT